MAIKTKVNQILSSRKLVYVVLVKRDNYSTLKSNLQGLNQKFLDSTFQINLTFFLNYG